MKNRRIFWIAGALAVWVLWMGSDVSGAEPAFDFTADDRLLIMAPHPDDEALGTGGMLQAALAAKARVKVVYFTHGDDNEAASLFYLKKPLLLKKDILKIGAVREAEARIAMSSLGVLPEDLVFLGYPDSGLMVIWRKHWGPARPFRSFLTKIDRVPYKDSYAPDSLFKGENIQRDLREILEAYRPTQVFVTAPFDLHADHQSAYLFLNLALLDLKNKISEPKLYFYLIHFSDWPPLSAKGGSAFGGKPPASISGDRRVVWAMSPLSQSQIKVKKQLLEKYSSQMAYNKKFLLSFVRTDEFFGRADFEKISAVDHTLKPAERAEFFIREGQFWISAPLKEPFDERGAFNLELFGYRSDQDFARMPKLSLRLFGKRLKVKDGFKNVYKQRILFRLEPNRVLIRLPLAALGRPQIVFTRMETSGQKPSLDFGSWRILEIPNEP